MSGSGLVDREPRPAAGPFRTVISLSDAAVEDVREFRRAFEPEVAALAATNADDARIAQLQRALRRFDDALEAEARLGHRRR